MQYTPGANKDTPLADILRELAGACGSALGRRRFSGKDLPSNTPSMAHSSFQLVKATGMPECVLVRA